MFSDFQCIFCICSTQINPACFWAKRDNWAPPEVNIRFATFFPFSNKNTFKIRRKGPRGENFISFLWEGGLEEFQTLGREPGRNNEINISHCWCDLCPLSWELSLKYCTFSSSGEGFLLCLGSQRECLGGGMLISIDPHLLFLQLDLSQSL